MKKIIFLVTIIGLLSSVMARSSVELLQNKRVSLSYGLVLLNTPAASVSTSLQMQSITIMSYSRNNQYYFGISIDNISGIAATDTYLQIDNSVLAGVMWGDFFTVSGGFGVSTVIGSTPSSFFAVNTSMLFLDISVFTVKYAYYTANSGSNLSILIGLTF